MCIALCASPCTLCASPCTLCASPCVHRLPPHSQPVYSASTLCPHLHPSTAFPPNPLCSIISPTLPHSRTMLIVEAPGALPYPLPYPTLVQVPYPTPCFPASYPPSHSVGRRCWGIRGPLTRLRAPRSRCLIPSTLATCTYPACSLDVLIPVLLRSFPPLRLVTCHRCCLGRLCWQK